MLKGYEMNINEQSAASIAQQIYVVVKRCYAMSCKRTTGCTTIMTFNGRPVQCHQLSLSAKHTGAFVCRLGRDSIASEHAERDTFCLH
jgi:hypothetical protein